MAFISTRKSFLKAAASGDLSEINDCISNGFDINTRDKDGVTVTAHAAKNGRIDVLKRLLSRAPDLEIADTDGNTALLAAVNGERTATAKMLIAAGADVNTHDNNYIYPIQEAAFRGDLDVIQALIDAKADINTVIRKNGRTALHWAVDKEFGPLVELLMKHGARTDIADTAGKTPLDIAKEKTPQRILKIMEPYLAQPAKAVPAALPANDSGETWALIGKTGVAREAVSAPLGRKFTEIFNFESRERVIISENLKTGAETMGTPEKFDTLAPDMVQRAEEKLKALGGELPGAAQKRSFNL